MEQIAGGANECVVAVGALSFGLLVGFFTGGLSLLGTAGAMATTAFACLADQTRDQSPAAAAQRGVTL